MVFSDTNDGNGLIQECERITGLGPTGISSNTQLKKDFTARLNAAKDRFYALVFQYDSAWNADDFNQTDLPIAVTNLVSGQQDYRFPGELLMVTQVFAKDSGGVFQELKEQEDKTNAGAYTLNATNGVPTHYELVGNSLLLTPIPNYNSTDGLKVVFKRNGPKFDPDDGGVAIGIPSLFHAYLARYASLPYLTEKVKANRDATKQDIVEDEMQIMKFMSNRAKPKRVGLRVTNEDNR